MTALLKDYPVVIECSVAWGEMDAMSHVNNTVYFRYFESARIAYFEKMHLIGYMAETGIGPILAETSCKFRSPLSYPDKVLVGSKVVGIKADRFIMHNVAFSTRQQKIAAEGESVIVTFNYREGKKAAVPEVVRKGILDMEKSVEAGGAPT
jgi:acyl-CoA thioester hydrolase